MKTNDEKAWLARHRQQCALAQAQVAALRRAGVWMAGPWAMADGVFESLEEKLIRLALDEAASMGEQQNAAVALIQSLRKRGIRPEALITGRELATKPVPVAVDAGLVKMPSCWRDLADSTHSHT